MSSFLILFFIVTPNIYHPSYLTSFSNMHFMQYLVYTLNCCLVLYFLIFLNLTFFKVIFLYLFHVPMHSNIMLLIVVRILCFILNPKIKDSYLYKQISFNLWILLFNTCFTNLMVQSIHLGGNSQGRMAYINTCLLFFLVFLFFIRLSNDQWNLLRFLGCRGGFKHK